MFVNRNERRIIKGKKTKPRVEKPHVIIPVNLLKRKYTVEQWRLYITRRAKHRGTCWIWMRANSNKPYGEVRVPMRDGSVKYLLPARIAVWAAGEPKNCKLWDYEPEIRLDRTCGNQSCVSPRHR